MPLIATAAADWNEDDPTKALIAWVKKIIMMRFGPSDAALIRDIQYITDLVHLEQILDLAKTSTLADIRTAIESAVPPPK